MNAITILFKHLWSRLFYYFISKKYYKQTSKKDKIDIEPFIPYFHPHKKPEWIKAKIMYLKVHLPKDGCRKIAMRFNQMYVHKDISISKSYVYGVIKENGYEILKQRKTMRAKLPRPMPKNIRWDMDLTTIDKRQIFGVIDSGSRALVILRHLATKSTINIIRAILYTIELYGKPKSVKSDNEIVFTSKLMRFTLWLLGIKQQTTDIASPWQNGKIERLFGTMKQSFENLIFPTAQSLQDGLSEFQFYYNHIRLHQNLDYNTPANVWNKKPLATSRTSKEIYYYKSLCENVTGFYFLE